MNNLISECCKSEVLEGFRDNPRDHHDPIPTYICLKCGNECQTIEDTTDSGDEHLQDKE